MCRSRGSAGSIPAAFPVLVSFLLLVVSAVVSAPALSAQGGGGPMVNQSDDPLLSTFRWRSIGPVGQGGRVDDIAVDPTDPHTFYVGFATGGLWKTTNNGVTFEPVFDTHSTHSIGDIAIAPSDPNVVWVGTGEANNRQSSSFGDGVFRSTDAGRSFTYMGLRETQTISRMHVHPTNPDVVWVAANGHLFGANPERGVFKTSDGGRTWRKTLYVDENTGATDLVVHPTNPDVLFAATYQRRRTSWGFVGGGPGSGIWKSTDGGENWTRLEGNGLPSGTKGRIALAISLSNPDVVYAQIEVAPDRNPSQPTNGLDPDDSGIWRSTDGGASWEIRSNENGRPMYFSQIRVDPLDPDRVWIVDQQVYTSTDGARSFERRRGYGHVDQHAMWINPEDGDHVMIGNDGSVDVTYDGGDTWESLRTWAVGQPYHASVDMRRPYYVCTGLQDNGSWCGPSSVRSGDILPQDWYRVGGGDGFYSAVDPTDWRIVYAESQNGNVRRLNLATGESGSIRPRGPGGNSEGNIVPTPEGDLNIRWNWNTPFILSPHNPSTVHLGGSRFFTSYDRGETWRMSPDLTKDVDTDAREIMGYPGSLPRCGSNQHERGERCILSRNDGVSRYGTMVSVAESPVVEGVLWAGTDDGNVQVSRDGGITWTEVGRNIPGGTREYYVSRVEASHFDPATAYVSLDGHRSDDLRPYVFVTRDYGQSWQSIAGNLPEYGNVNTVRQDPKNPSLLYVGTEFAFFVSLDEGRTWKKFMNNLPTVRIDDVLVHPRDNDLVLATHGRSVWILDDITPLQQLTPEVMAQGVFLMEPRDAVLWRNNIRLSRSVTGDKNWEGESAPDGTAIAYYLGSRPSGQVSLSITDMRTGEVFRDLDATTNQGLNRVRWNLRGNPREQGGGGGGFGGGGQGPMADPGVYRVTLTVAGREYTRMVNVLVDVWMDQGERP